MSVVLAKMEVITLLTYDSNELSVRNRLSLRGRHNASGHGFCQRRGIKKKKKIPTHKGYHVHFHYLYQSPCRGFGVK